MTKICNICKVEKDVSEFYPDPKKKDDYSNRCKPCRKTYNNAWRKTHPDTYKRAYLERRKKNPIRIWAYQTLYQHRRRGIATNITASELVEFTKQHPRCQFCGEILDYSWGKKTTSSKSPTLDRKNNESTIDSSNILILCHKCNRTKSDRTLAEFKTYCRTIANLDIS